MNHAAIESLDEVLDKSGCIRAFPDFQKRKLIIQAVLRDGGQLDSNRGSRTLDVGLQPFDFLRDQAGSFNGALQTFGIENGLRIPCWLLCPFWAMKAKAPLSASEISSPCAMASRVRR